MRATIGKLVYYLVLATVAAGGFHIGHRQATASPARLEDVALEAIEGRTRLTVTLDEGTQVGVEYDRPAKRIALRFPGAEIPSYLKDLAYRDDLIESVAATLDDATGDALLTLTFHDDQVSFFREGKGDDAIVTFDFRPGQTPLVVKNLTPTQFAQRLARRPEPTPEPTPAPTPEPEAIVEPTPAPTPVPEGPSAEELQRRFSKIDEVFPDKRLRAGRDAYIALMKQMRVENEEGLPIAIQMARQFLRDYPDSIYREHALYTLANATYLLSKRNTAVRREALTAYNEAMATYPKSVYYPQAMMRRGDLFREQAFDIEALTEYGSLIQNFPRGKYAVPSMLARADIYMSQKKYQRAHNELEKILVLFPTRREVRDVKYLIAESYYDRGIYDVAMTIFEDAMKRWPTFPKTHPRTYLKIADTRYRLGMKEAAGTDFLALANLFPELEEGRRATLRLGDLYVEQGRPKEGLAIYENLIHAAPKRDEAVLAKLRMASLGAENPDLLAESRIFDYDAFVDPLATFDAVFKKYPEKFGQEALTRKGVALTGMKRYLTSILTLRELLKTYPATRLSDEVFGMVRENLVRLIDVYHSQNGFFMALLTYYDNFDPFLRSIEDPVTLGQIADSYDAMTLYDRAIDYYRLAARFDPSRKTLPRLAYRIGKATVAQGKYDEAAVMLTRYMTEFPRSPWTVPARHLLGEALYRSGKPADAATEWRIAIEADPNHPLTSESAYLLGDLYKKERNIPLAVDSFTLAIDSFAVNRPEAVAVDGEPPYVKDSYYQLAEAFYLGERYADAIRAAQRYLARYPDDGKKEWMEYIVSASLSRIDKDDEAVARLTALSEKGPDSIIGKVAAARLESYRWKQQNPELFAE
jgi:TolA-binding protein